MRAMKKPMEPTRKSPAMEKLLDSMTPNPLGRRGSIKAGVCSWCGGPATEFRDEISKREYRISGFCQRCQDEVFER